MEDKILKFENMVLEEASRESECILEEAAREKECLCDEEYTRLLEHVYKHLSREKAAIIHAKNERVAASASEHRLKLLRLREEKLADMFGEIERRLKEYTKTQEYKSYLLNAISECCAQLNSPNTKISISENDKPLVEGLTDLTIDYLSSDIIGGFIALDEENGLLVDESLRAKLDTKKKEFLGESALTIQ